MLYTNENERPKYLLDTSQTLYKRKNKALSTQNKIFKVHTFLDFIGFILKFHM